MTLTTTQISNFINELRTFSPVLERSELPFQWPESLLQDYSAKGNLLDRLIEVNIALLGEIEQLTPLSGNTNPEGSVTANRSGLYLLTLPGSTAVFFNANRGSTTGWLEIAS